MSPKCSTCILARVRFYSKRRGYGDSTEMFEETCLGDRSDAYKSKEVGSHQSWKTEERGSPLETSKGAWAC